MKALVKIAPGVGNVEIRDVPEPACGPGCVKIDVAYTGVCGTDLHVYHDTFKNYPPVILGHEFSGHVVETGKGVTDIAVGERMVILPSSAVVCGNCEFCRQGYYMFCPIRRGMGHGVNGSFTKYAVVRADQCYRIPEGVGLQEAAVSEPFASAYQVIEELTPICAGDTVLLSGPGPIGLLCLMLLVARGARVIVAGTSADTLRLDLALTLGAAVAVDVTTDDLQAVIAAETGGRGADAVIECSGAAPSVLACLQAVRKMGAYLQVGILGREITLPFDIILYKQLRVYGSVGHSLKTWDGVMRVLAQRKIDLTRIITHTLPLSRWREGFDLCEAKRGVKVMLTYDE